MNHLNGTNSTGGGTGNGTGNGTNGEGCSVINNINVYCGNCTQNSTGGGNGTGGGTGGGNGTGGGPVLDNCNSTNILSDKGYYEFW